MASLQIGKLAPKIVLLNQNEEVVDLSSFKGKNIVIYFYPKAMTPGCTTQACGVRDSKKELDKLNTVVFGISNDEPKKLKKFIEKEKLNFDLLSDPENIICEKFGVWGLKKFMGKEYMGIIRTTFILDTNGKLLHILNDFKTKSHHLDLLNCLNEKVL